MSAPPVLAVENLSIALPEGAERPFAVRDLSLAIRAGECLCVVGESGSGKSMLAHAVAGLLPPGVRVAGGAARLEGRDVVGLSDAAMRSLRGARVGMVFQEPMTSLNPVARVGRQVEEVFEAHGRLDPGGRRARAVALLDEVGLPEPARLARAYPHELSGGQRQRVMIAMALALEPALLIADEPTTALDVTTQAGVLRLIASLRAKHGTAVLFITHDFGVVTEVADRVLVMQGGEGVEEGEAAQVLRAPRAPYTRRLLAAVPGLAPPPPRPAPTGEPVLLAEGLGKTYRARGLFGRGREVVAAAGVSLSLRRGETLGLVGESGSGKSTVGRLLLRLVEPDAGTVTLEGRDVTGLSARAFRPLRRSVQMVFQDPYASLNPRRRVGRIIAEGPEAHGLPRAEAEARARGLLDEVGLPGSFERLPHEFSGGQRQRVGLARALALEPAVLIADEPVSALDVSVQAGVLALIKGFQERLGLAVLFVTHDLRVAAQVCDRVAVMRGGLIVEEGPTAALFTAPAHPYTRALLAAVPGAGKAA